MISPARVLINVRFVLKTSPGMLLLLQILIFSASFSLLTGHEAGELCQTKDGLYGNCLSYWSCRLSHPKLLLSISPSSTCGPMRFFKSLICCPYKQSEDCGLPFSGVGTRISKGQVVMDSTWPWMVALGEQTWKSKDPDFFCGGALISPTHVLTAAHCSSRNIRLVRMGNYDLNHASVLDIKVKKVHIYPSYSSSISGHDIAIVELNHAYNASWRIRPICLPSATSKEHFGVPSQTVYVAGWGRTMLEGPTSSKLLHAELSVVDLMSCNATYFTRWPDKYKMGVAAKTICAGGAKIDADSSVPDSCIGDSGGPLIFRNSETGQNTIIGIVSRGHGCGIPGVPGLYTGVVTHLPWIYEILAR